MWKLQSHVVDVFSSTEFVYLPGRRMFVVVTLSPEQLKAVRKTSIVTHRVLLLLLLTLTISTVKSIFKFCLRFY